MGTGGTEQRISTPKCLPLGGTRLPFENSDKTEAQVPVVLCPQGYSSGHSGQHPRGKAVSWGFLKSGTPFVEGEALLPGVTMTSPESWGPFGGSGNSNRLHVLLLKSRMEVVSILPTLGFLYHLLLNPCSSQLICTLGTKSLAPDTAWSGPVWPHWATETLLDV